ncbi:MAG: hypothetical protein ACRCV9_00355 [Burkholderiaceae bacterium]
MRNAILILIPTLLVFGGLAWTMLVGARAQRESDEFTEAWARKHLGHKASGE